MIDESKHRFWKGELIQCRVCGHKISIEDHSIYRNRCPFCANPVKPLLKYEIIVKEEPAELEEVMANG